jgi:cytochrome P450
MCIGNHFAMLEAQLVLASWLSRARFELTLRERPVALAPLITLRPEMPVRMTVLPR